jgi:hypothetical protein
MRSRLLWKLLGINIVIIGVVIVIVWLSIDYLAAGYFMTLMDKYHISPTSSHEMFVSAVHRSWSSCTGYCSQFLDHEKNFESTHPDDFDHKKDRIWQLFRQRPGEISR